MPKTVTWEAWCLHFGTAGYHFGTSGVPWETVGAAGVDILRTLEQFRNPIFESCFGTGGSFLFCLFRPFFRALFVPLVVSKSGCLEFVKQGFRMESIAEIHF